MRIARSNKLVSIIVPVYNVEKYLKRCIDSILSQTYHNLEIILVDDGSTDYSGAICDRYAEQDYRIRVIHKKNGGLSDARNSGLDIAKGDYIAFIDSDDWISDDYVNVLVKALEYGKTQISACSYRKVSGLTKYNEVTGISSSGELEIWTILEAYQHLFLNKKIDCSAWAKLYKHTLFRDIRFPVGKLYEDQFTTYKLFHSSQGVTYIDQEMYFYFNRPESIQNERFTIRKMDELEANLECFAFIEEKYPSLHEEVLCKLVSSCFHMLFAIDSKVEWKNQVEQLEKIIKANRIKMITGRNVNRKVRVGCLCSCFGFRFAKHLYLKSGVRGKINI